MCTCTYIHAGTQRGPEVNVRHPFPYFLQSLWMWSTPVWPKHLTSELQRHTGFCSITMRLPTDIGRFLTCIPVFWCSISCFVIIRFIDSRYNSSSLVSEQSGFISAKIWGFQNIEKYLDYLLMMKYLSITDDLPNYSIKIHKQIQYRKPEKTFLMNLSSVLCSSQGQNPTV